MNTVRVVVVMLDGTKCEGTGVYMPLSDRVAFEHRFGISVIANDQGMFDADGKLVPNADLSKMREEHSAFFCWSLLHRAGSFAHDFEQFISSVEELNVFGSELEGESVDPTGVIPPTPS